MEIHITGNAAKKMRGYINGTPGEISGMAASRVSEDKQSIEVFDCWIWRQECSAGATDAKDINAVFELIEEAKRDGVTSEDVNVWWHSHAMMGAFFSSPDVTTIEKWLVGQGGYLLSIVGNKAKQWEGRIDVRQPFELFLEVNNVDITEEAATLTREEAAAITADIAAKVEVKKWASGGVYPQRAKNKNEKLKYQYPYGKKKVKKYA